MFKEYRISHLCTPKNAQFVFILGPDSPGNVLNILNILLLVVVVVVVVVAFFIVCIVVCGAIARRKKSFINSVLQLLVLFRRCAQMKMKTSINSAQISYHSLDNAV